MLKGASLKQVLLVCRYDVNVTPDKRKVFIQEEAQILTALQQVALNNLHRLPFKELLACLQ